MSYLTVGKENSGTIDLYYEDHGAGRSVILVHGWPLSSKSWEKQVPVLLESGYRVVTYDRRGFGNSGKPTFGYDYDTLAEDLHKLMTELDLAEATLVGFSMGGGEVARYLGTYGSDRVEKAVFISAIPPFLLKTADNPEGVDGSVFDGIMESIAADRPAFLSGFLSDFYNVDIFGGDRVSDEVVRLSWNVAAAASPVGTLDCVPAWLTDFRDDLASIDVPVLVIHGDADRIVPFPASGKRTPGLVKDSRLVVIEGGPHGITWTHADRVNRELLNFLGQRVQAAQPFAANPT
ncbi:MULTISPECIES: alpha/beta fold hydrolase [Methanoculleus]|uniref:Alpha/beta hydrolase fold protein n=2 Tax=Methanoculleus TaxID=45989 RepID=A3CTX0_METMJ|nr:MULTISPECIES: alpha/beta hydrolase [Methanoculleus]ABN56820.1 alpha/beta hydrolase fold protein [Methanoculleus marisnigri JR1]MCC7556617.1 alpha/beta hydrolase [Methanoculleus marisnigri]UYU18248.1 alpha/beta hydrolase [Methanoculleus submarinus]